MLSPYLHYNNNIILLIIINEISSVKNNGWEQVHIDYSDLATEHHKIYIASFQRTYVAVALEGGYVSI